MGGTKYFLLNVVLGMVFSSTGMADTTFSQKLNNFDNDVFICNAFVSKSICTQVEILIKDRNRLLIKFDDSQLQEDTPLTVKYYQDKELCIAVIGNTELLLDTRAHYFPLGNGELFVVVIETPHVDELEKLATAPLTQEEKLPISYGFLFKDGKVEKKYSVQGSLHPDIFDSKIDEILSAFNQYAMMPTSVH